MAVESFRDFVAQLDRAGELIHVSQPVATELEITELANRQMKSPGGGKALLIEKPTVNGQPSFALGEKVMITSLNSEGIVTALGESEAEVQIGSLRIRAKLNDLEKHSVPAEGPKHKAQNTSEVPSTVRRPASTIGMEISLRGKLVARLPSRRRPAFCGWPGPWPGNGPFRYVLSYGVARDCG